jgi:hypothetical protein
MFKNVFVNILWDSKMFKNEFVNISDIPKRLKMYLQKFWDPKNMHFHLMYLKRGSIIGLMMTP